MSDLIAGRPPRRDKKLAPPSPGPSPRLAQRIPTVTLLHARRRAIEQLRARPPIVARTSTATTDKQPRSCPRTSGAEPASSWTAARDAHRHGRRPLLGPEEYMAAARPAANRATPTRTRPPRARRNLVLLRRRHDETHRERRVAADVSGRPALSTASQVLLTSSRFTARRNLRAELPERVGLPR